MRAILFAVVAIASVVSAKDVIAVTNCQDAQCTTGCQTQTFNQNQCLREQNSQDTVELSCPALPAVCTEIEYYSDSACTTKSATFNTVCGNCNGEFQIVCGALEYAVYYVFQCSGNCGVCNNDTVVPYNKCVNVDGKNFKVKPGFNCVPVGFNTYNVSSCGGTPVATQYPSGYCVGGSILTCKSNSSEVDTTVLPQIETPNSRRLREKKLAGIRRL